MSLIFAEIIKWNDQNADGVVDDGEEVSSYGKKSIVKWKTEGIDLGTMETGELLGLIVRFSTETIGDTKQGKTAIFDFEFNSIGTE